MYVVLLFGDSETPDHISAKGTIAEMLEFMRWVQPRLNPHITEWELISTKELGRRAYLS